MKPFDMSDRRNEIPRMIEILENHEDWESLTFFQYKGGNGDLIKPLTKIRIARSKPRQKRKQYVVSIGAPNPAERTYIRKFTSGDNGMWPDDFFERYSGE